MPGFILHAGATVTCSHQGRAEPSAVNPRVKVNGQAVVTVVAPYRIQGCPVTVGGASVPCVIGLWTSAATRVTASGQPLVIVGSTSTCILNFTPMIVSKTQMRVSAA